MVDPQRIVGGGLDGVDQTSVSSMSVRAEIVLFVFPATLLAQCLVEGFSRPLQQGEERQGGSLQATQPSPKLQCRAARQLQLPGQPGRLSGCTQAEKCSLWVGAGGKTAKAGHCFHHEAWAGQE